MKSACHFSAEIHQFKRFLIIIFITENMQIVQINYYL